MHLGAALEKKGKKILKKKKRIAVCVICATGRKSERQGWMRGECSTFKLHPQGLPGISFSICKMGRLLIPAQMPSAPPSEDLASKHCHDGCFTNVQDQQEGDFTGWQQGRRGCLCGRGKSHRPSTCCTGRPGFSAGAAPPRLLGDWCGCPLSTSGLESERNN